MSARTSSSLSVGLLSSPSGPSLYVQPGLPHPGYGTRNCLMLPLKLLTDTLKVRRIKTVCWGDWGQFILVLLNKSTRNLLTLHLITMLCTLTKCAYLTIPVFSMREWLTYIEIWLFQANHKCQFTGKIHGLCAFAVCISWLFWVSYARKSIDGSLKLQIGFVYPLCHFCHSL